MSQLTLIKKMMIKDQIIKDLKKNIKILSND